MIKTLASVELCLYAHRSRTERQKLIASIFINLSLFPCRMRCSLEHSAYASAQYGGSSIEMCKTKFRLNHPHISQLILAGIAFSLLIACYYFGLCDEREYFRQSYRTHHVYLCCVRVCSKRRNIIVIAYSRVYRFVLHARVKHPPKTMHTIRIFLCVPNWFLFVVSRVEYSGGQGQKQLLKNYFHYADLQYNFPHITFQHGRPFM